MSQAEGNIFKADEEIKKDETAIAESPATGVVNDQTIVQKAEEKPRFYYVDWIRTIAIHLVIFIHATNQGMEMRRFHFKKKDYPGNEWLQIEERTDGAQRMLCQIGIPAFFYVSGFSTTFFNTEKKTYKTYLYERFKRLILPLIPAIIFFLIPRLYLCQEYSPYGYPPQKNKDGKTEPEWNIFKYYGKMLPGGFFLKISWLWFLPALFLDSQMAYPLLKWSQRRYKELPITLKEDGAIIGGQVFLVTLWAVFTYFMVPSELGIKNNLPSDIILLCVLFCFFFIPYKVVGRENGYKYSLLLRFIGIIGTIVLCPLRDGYNSDDLYMVVSMINFDLIFMAQGLIDQIYWREQKKSLMELKDTLFVPLMVLLFFIQYSFCSPTSREGQGFIFTYPIYNRTEFQVIHVVGTWYWLFLIMLTCSYILNSKFSDKWYGYDLWVGSSMYVYIAHYFMMMIPIKMIEFTKIQQWWAVVILMIITEGILISTWQMILWAEKKYKERKAVKVDEDKIDQLELKEQINEA